jgi:hypothetical protein
MSALHDKPLLTTPRDVCRGQQVQVLVMHARDWCCGGQVCHVLRQHHLNHQLDGGVDASQQLIPVHNHSVWQSNRQAADRQARLHLVRGSCKQKEALILGQWHDS